MSEFNKLTDAEAALLNNTTCPDCLERHFLEGPHGGMNVNIMCAECGAKFNVVPGLAGAFGKKRIGKPDPKNL